MKILLQVAVLAVLTFNAPAHADEKSAEAGEPVGPRLVDVKRQIYARYVAAGQENERKGLWGPSDNYPRSIAAHQKFGDPEKLSVIVDLDENVSRGQYAGNRIRIVNRSDERVLFAAIDSHLYLVLEARNDKGEWQPVERTPHGTGPRDCAVGFHCISLKPGQYWNLEGPRYTGSFKTKLRYRLDLGKSDRDIPQPGGKLIYSEKFDGAINPEQFQPGPTTGLDLKPL
jgi:hypothetical protein